MHFSRLSTTAVLAAASALAAPTTSNVQQPTGLKGFNYGALNPDGSAAQYQNFLDYFNTARNLQGTSGAFTSARLYTMIQGGTANTPISAIPAAIASNTSLLLGLWASAGQEVFNNELAALSNAINQYGSAFTDRVIGISVGSEDLYRNSVTGAQNNAGIGTNPDVLVRYIGQTRALVAKTSLAAKPLGHVDTWNDFVNGTNSAVISAVDFLGMNAFPYFQTTVANTIESSNATFFSAYDATVGVAQGKPIWITETGWPLSGPQSGLASASVANAQSYWKTVGCTLFGAKNVGINTFWYTLFDGTPSPSFGVVGSALSTTPAFDLTCPA